MNTIFNNSTNRINLVNINDNIDKAVIMTTLLKPEFPPFATLYPQKVWRNFSPSATTQTNYSTIYKAALEYHSNGFSVIPVQRDSKKPAVKWKEYQTRPPTEEELFNWFVIMEYQNLAIVTGEISGIIVIDCDSEEAYNKLCQQYDFGETPIVRTRRGYHIWLKHTKNVDGLNNTTKILPDIDIKTNHGYIIAPPTTFTASNSSYQWVNQLERDKLIPIPEGLLAKINEALIKSSHNATTGLVELSTNLCRSVENNTPYGEKVLAAQAAKVEKTPVGKRNDELFKAAICVSSFIAGGEINREDAYNRLHKAGETCGLDTNEIKRTIENGFKYGSESPKCARKYMQIPKGGKLISEFANELAEILIYFHNIYKRNNKACFINNGGIEYFTADSFRTWIEKYTIPFIKKNDRKIKKSISKEHASAILSSESFLNNLPEINGINKVRQPIVRENGLLELLPVGYDEETGIYTFGEVEYKTKMDIDTAKSKIDNLFDEFPFSNDTFKSVAIAAMFSIYGKHLIPEDATKPAFFYIANAEGAGKSLLMKCAVTPTYGIPAMRSAPQSEDEMRKELVSCAMEAANVICLDNVKNQLSSSSLESFLTTNKPTGRILGTNKNIDCKTNVYVLISGNHCTVSPDLRRRSLFCELHMKEECAEHRTIKNWMDDVTLKEKRSEILAAMWAIIKHWHNNKPSYVPIQNNTFLRWGEVFAAILVSAGWKNPLENVELESGGDILLKDMKILVKEIYNGKKLVSFNEILDICKNNDLFQDILLDSNEPGGDVNSPKIRSKLGKRLKKYNNRVFHINLKEKVEFKIEAGSGKKYSVKSVE